VLVDVASLPSTAWCVERQDGLFLHLNFRFGDILAGMNRRSTLKIAMGAPFFNFGTVRLFGQERKYSVRAIDLMKQSTVIDMLSPFALAASQSVRLRARPETFTPGKLQEYRESGIHVFHIAEGVGSTDVYGNNVRFLGVWNSFLAYHEKSLKRISTAADIDDAKASGKIGVILGLQDSAHFRGVPDVDEFYAYGQRVSQLTYNSRNLIGNGLTERRDEGLSGYGLSIVGRMNQVGMAVDVSHSGDATTLDALEVSKKPVLFTHINCRALSGHVRAKTDEAIKKCAERGGLMGITGLRNFLKADEPTTVEDYLTSITRAGLPDRSFWGSAAISTCMATMQCRKPIARLFYQLHGCVRVS
jgi:membrane dipeptidase